MFLRWFISTSCFHFLSFIHSVSMRITRIPFLQKYVIICDYFNKNEVGNPLFSPVWLSYWMIRVFFYVCVTNPDTMPQRINDGWIIANVVTYYFVIVLVWFNRLQQTMYTAEPRTTASQYKCLKITIKRTIHLHTWSSFIFRWNQLNCVSTTFPELTVK